MNYAWFDPTVLPRKLFRDQHQESRTLYHSQRGFRAADTSCIKEMDSAELGERLRLHLDWSRSPSLFISVFGDERHARNWALARGDESVCMWEIDASQLQGVHVLQAFIANGARGFSLRTNNQHEYLVVGTIPAQAVVKKSSYHDLCSARERVEEQRSEHWNHIRRIRNGDPHYHHDAELGWYDSDDEAEIRNRNDDLMKMIEGDW